MEGYLSLILHAHLPFVRHPEHENFLEENWLFEAITETYIPLLQVMEKWQEDGIKAGLTVTLTPTLCSMLQDSLLQERYLRRLEGMLELADKEVHRTHWEKPLNALAEFYRKRFTGVRDYYIAARGDLVGAFKQLQDSGSLEIITCAATHALLPLLDHPPSLRAQIMVGRDHYRACFGRDPRGIWLPECAYDARVEPALAEAKLRWFILETHGVLHAEPRPRHANFAPILTPSGLAAFGRDFESAKQVWSRSEGYPGDARYRDFYRDAGFDLEEDYLKKYLPGTEHRGFTGLKYYRITGGAGAKAVYERGAALAVADQHAEHFLKTRGDQVRKVKEVMKKNPLLVAPYDAELFGHWWYEGPEFLDLLARKAAGGQQEVEMITPQQYLERHPTQQVASPAASSWGEGGYWGVWLNEKTAWIYPRVRVAQERMSELARHFTHPNALEERALRQAGRELLLAQSSDWAFILRAGTSPEYARGRITGHLENFNALFEQLNGSQVKEDFLKELENRDNLFPDLNYQYWQ